jgi:hypothetical protein
MAVVVGLCIKVLGVKISDIVLINALGLEPCMY